MQAILKKNAGEKNMALTIRSMTLLGAAIVLSLSAPQRRHKRPNLSG